MSSQYRRLPGGGGGGGRGRGDHQGDGGDIRTGNNKNDNNNSVNDTNSSNLNSTEALQYSNSTRSRYHSTSSHSIYGDVHRNPPKHYYTSLVDVLFCLVMALAWTVWILSSFVKSDLLKYQHDSVLVRGHVLHVSVEGDSLGTGIPIYKAIIDYMVPPLSQVPLFDATLDASNVAVLNRNSLEMEGIEQGNIQIRKKFETSQLLTEGFANVELLVLPHEPTYSVLKDDWERDFASIRQQQHRSTYQNEGGGTVLLTRTNTLEGVSTISGNNNETVATSFLEDVEWWRTPWFRRASITGAGFLVLASVVGGIQVVTRLSPSQRQWGWAIVVMGVLLLLPIAIGVQYGLVKVQRMFDSPMIVHGAERLASRATCTSTCKDILDSRGACDDEDTTIITSPTRAASTTGEGCYFVKFNEKLKSSHDEHVKTSQFASTPTPSLLITDHLSIEGFGLKEAISYVHDSEERSRNRSTTSSETSVSSVSMPELRDL